MENRLLGRLKDWFIVHPKTLIALSGGVDSCLVAYLARKYNGKENAVALIGASPSLKNNDLILAKDFCEKNDINYRLIYPNELNDNNYASNPIDRCYYCKSALYEEMLQLRDMDYPEFEILNGNNYGDRGDYRPGMKAAKEYTALSPLIDCELEKEDIRRLSKEFKLTVWDKPASPCLSSRFPYGEAISKDKLKLVEQAENMIFELGFSDVRVRYNKKNAKVEVPFNEVNKLIRIKDKITQEFQKIGFDKVEVDEEGLISGKLNRGIITDKSK